MKNRILLTTLTSSLLLMAASYANAAIFSKSGTIIRTLATDVKFGGCMIQLDVKVGGTENSCPNNGWVSLDCDAIHTTGKAGERMYSSAMVAASLKQTVVLSIDDSKKNTLYCVATRLDVKF